VMARTPSPLDQSIEEPLWFGPDERPLFGWLARPQGKSVRGGVLLAPPVGREMHAARRALRHVALSMAARGFVTLRFDYYGTGDSSGALDDPELGRGFVDSVAEAAAHLRSLGLEPISAIGMRLGATVVGVAAATHGVQFSSVVLWDPCESGRSYLRELSALEALRREGMTIDSDGPVETPEFVFTRQAALELRALRLSDPGPGSIANQVLVVSRADRAISGKLRDRLDREEVHWLTTSEQGALLDVEPRLAVLPGPSADQIMAWLDQSPSPDETFEVRAARSSALVAHEPGRLAVRERCVQLGSHLLFGIVSEPVGGASGPWIVFLNVSNGEHTGPSRLWVELSRRWAGRGLRCVRIDFEGIGDSPWVPGQPQPHVYDQGRVSDAAEVMRVLSPEDPSNSVFVGLCSGAFLGLEAALALQSRAACAINPPIGMDVLHAAVRLGGSRRRALRALATLLKEAVERLRWVAAGAWELCRMLLPSTVAADLLVSVADRGSEVLVLASYEDRSPSTAPVLRTINSYPFVASKGYDVEWIEGLDHGMHAADGRARTVDSLDRYVLGRFATATPLPSTRPTSN